MDRSRSFRHYLLARIGTLLGLSIPAAGVICTCGSHVTVDGTSANSGDALEGGQCGAALAKSASRPQAGRPHFVDGPRPTAPLQHGGSGWTADARPEVGSLGAKERAGLAQAWAADGLIEHASVASFGRFATELLAAGAPAILVADAHRAALDEVRHARMCFALASAYAGETLSPGPFDFGRGLPAHTDLVGLAQRTFLEGCVGETLAAVHAEEQLAIAVDPAVRQILSAIAEDEARHSELAWRALGWLLKVGDERHIDAVRATLLTAMERLEIQGEDAAVSPHLQAHGRLSGASSRAVMERALLDVVVPCARGLLGSPGHERRRAEPPDPSIVAAAS